MEGNTLAVGLKCCANDESDYNPFPKEVVRLL
jgi:hypothetical protein